MTKRAYEKFPRVADDFYPTPEAAVKPLLYWLQRDGIKTFAEPCVGDGSLHRYLETNGFRCTAWGDVSHGLQRDALDWTPKDFNGAQAVVTNPPWKPAVMHSIMRHLSTFLPCWFLVYWDWPSTHQSKVLMTMRCTDVVPIGRVKWIPNSKSVGFDNACWVKMSTDKDSHKPTALWPMLP